jgi:hypothetical protein
VTDSQDETPAEEVPTGLRPFMHEPMCPKCASTGVRVAYHPTIVVSLWGDGQTPCVSWLHAGVLLPDTGQHLCLVCTRCGYGWSTRTADVAFMEGLEDNG